MMPCGLAGFNNPRWQSKVLRWVFLRRRCQLQAGIVGVWIAAALLRKPIGGATPRFLVHADPRSYIHRRRNRVGTDAGDSRNAAA
jgi:hypothetical protein